MTEENWDVLVRRDDFGVTDIRDAATPTLEPGEVRLSVERFGVTSNNVTYAYLGEAANYWDAFPAPAGWGRVPAWGFATVEASRHPDHAEGTRVFGLVPTSTQLVVSPEPAHGGFSDSAPHRRRMIPFYRRYRVGGPGDALDGIRTIFRPLFPTSLLLADFVSEKAAELDARVTVLVTSASSKTALGLAHALSGRDRVTTHGLTSAGNLAFVRGTGLYDAVTAYDAVEDAGVTPPVILLDFAGNRAVVSAVHGRLGGDLALSLIAGGTHTEAFEARTETAGLPGPTPSRISGPALEAERVERVGAAAYAAVVDEAEGEFVAAARHWLRVDDRSGADAVVRALADAFSGRLDADVVRVLRPNG